jgi:hypothetical protein
MSEKLEEVRDKASKELLNKSGVSGTGIGKKYINGIPTEEDAILVFVQKKINPNTIRRQGVDEDIVPDEIDGIPTDVIEVGEITLQAAGFRNKVRPIKPGYSISHGNVTAGTIGGLFRDGDGDVVALSNFHVLANDGKAKPGDIIYQPGTADTRANLKFNGWSKPYDKHSYIGTLKRFNPLNSNGKHDHDSAIAKIHPELVKGGYIDDIYPQLGRPLTGFANAAVGETVYKCGRTTGFTTGRIIGHNAEFKISYGFGMCTFKGITLTHAMSKGGDSGSIGLNKDMKAFGLLFAGSRKVTLYNPIGPVVRYYGLKPLHLEEETVDAKWQGINWRTATTDGKIEFTPESVNFIDNANHHCYIETTASNAKHIRATINTGTDGGATWGIGAALIFPNCSLRLNLRCKGTYGAYVNRASDLHLGKTLPNTTYHIVFHRNDTHWVGMIENAKGQKVRLLEIPLQVTGKETLCIRVGKMGDNNGPKDNARPGGRNAGAIGTCKLLECVVR